MPFHGGDDCVSIAILEINIEALPLRGQISFFGPRAHAQGELEEKLTSEFASGPKTEVLKPLQSGVVPTVSATPPGHGESKLW